MFPMRLSKLIEVLDVVELRVNDPEHEIAFITEDSRKCASDALFVAYRGTKLDGHDFIADALKRGAGAIVCEAGLAVIDPDDRIPNIVRVTNGRYALAALAAKHAGDPSRQLRLIGVTGTNGKTTIVSILTAILRSAGIKALALTTVGTYDGCNYLNESDLTTPDPVFLQERFKRALREGISHIALEVSSHALAQHRIARTRFLAGAFTNLTEDHLDFHGDMKSYEDAKAIFFKEYMVDPSKQFVVINKDDPVGRKFAAITGAQVLTCSLHDDSADVYAGNRELTPFGSRFELLLNVSKLSQVSSAWFPQTSRAALKVVSGLPGAFNVSNVAIAAGLACGLGVPEGPMLEAIAAFNGVPGRMEKIEEGQDFSVIVDYAHTPDALRNVLDTLNQLRQQTGRLILVTGNGGDRDMDKRPLCGEIGARFSDRLILTNDNPRTEDPQQIINDIVKGVPADRMSILDVVPDRREAIRRAISEAKEGDCVLIAGKGHEDYQVFGSEKRHFDDRREAREAIREKLGAKPRS